MSVRALSVLLAFVLLSGCFVEEDPGTVATDDAGDGASGTGTASVSKATSGASAKAGSTGANGTGAPPVLGNLSLNLTGLEAVFTITASDADNDTVTFVLAFGDNTTANGTLAAPANATGTAPGTVVATVPHAYAAAGEYNATLTLSDGKSSVNSTLAVAVTGGVASIPMDPLRFTGSCTTEVSERVTHTFDVTPGQDFIHGAIAIGGGGVDLDWYLYDPSGDEADAAESFSARSEGPLDVDDPVAGTWSVAVVCFVGVAASYTADLTFA